METIVLAGGLGTRLRKVVTDIPKPMAQVNNSPFLWHIFRWIKFYPVEKLVVSAGYKAEIITDYFGNSVFDIPVEYAVEDQPLGTGGAIKFAIQKTSGSDILILNGDTYFPIDLRKFISFHRRNQSLFSIALKRLQNFDRYGTVECEENTVMRFIEKKPCKEGLINGGIYLIKRQLIESWDFPGPFSLENDIMEKESGSGILKGMVFDDPFIDIGVPEDYQRASAILRNY